MSTCKECLCFKMCLLSSEKVGICEHFKDRSKFIELPCKVGDTVYTIVQDEIKENKITSVCYIKTITFTSFEFHVENFRGASLLYTQNSIGEKIFLTKDEAEKALEERGKK